ncbi:magnesium chelatase [Candidatus Campbellbacteria bacterium RIFCSPLOWO2_02_FULL_35_11]|uniref:Magnesium chelatase n=1 Tax=Candidatus Campbellbacteria bacterium RIFCSPLOWO2_02_FULL_35_11 TaxID=1797581 RepID=A0A1F5ET61_9BACT|nr:MAG: magnesium chelatase [Candidatus Campbellbacteria bacterium RIFCSPLOWO2_02_FULL_35_11]
MFSKVYSAQTNLLDAHIIDIEIDITDGTLHNFSVVGLPDKAVEESRDRVSAAIKNSGFKSPKSQNSKIVIALAPANLKKEGPNFDLGIALAYLLANEEIQFDTSNKIFLGELALDGTVRKTRGVLPLVRKAKEKGFKEVYLPKENVLEGALIDGIKIYGVENLKQLLNHLNERHEENLVPQPTTKIKLTQSEYSVDFADIKGQENAKRGLEIAAAGGHNIAMYGPPGTGKTMLAKAFCHILPPLSFDDILEVTSIHSVAGILNKGIITQPPFRAPHHTSSHISIVGGGSFPKPGEITLAHKGVLFVDEFPEFERRVIDSLRQPLEDKIINISRSKGSAIFPANFILIATMNPCPCGNYKSKKECTCNMATIQKYQRKISGPIIDRVDMWVRVDSIDYKNLSNEKNGVKTDKIKEKIISARNIQKERFGKEKTNGDMSSKEIEKHIKLDNKVKDFLNESAEKLKLSARAYHKVIKLARTIADLNNSKEITDDHLLEALSYRPKENSL